MALIKDEEQQPKRIISSEDSQSLPTLLPEIVVEILLKLPVESLVKCRYVCKLWYSFISDPRFIKSHVNLSTRNKQYANHRLIFTTWARLPLNICPLYDVLFNKSVDNALELGYPLKQYAMKPDLSIAGSCNGLLCIVVEHYPLFICNPSTKRSNRVPSCSFSSKRRSGWYVMYGFGYDEATDDYKVVGISRCYQNRAKDENKVKVYSLKTGDWKKIDDFPLTNPLTEYGKFSNGALHWIATGSNYPLSIVSLDLANESFGEVLQPVYCEGGDKDLTLGVLGDWLCVLCNYGGTRVDVWVMKVYGVKDSWTNLVSIPYIANPERDRFFLEPLFISNDEKILVKFGSKLVVCDSKNSSFSEIQDFEECVNACTFVESLVSPGFW